MYLFVWKLDLNSFSLVQLFLFFFIQMCTSASTRTHARMELSVSTIEMENIPAYVLKGFMERTVSWSQDHVKRQGKRFWQKGRQRKEPKEAGTAQRDKSPNTLTSPQNPGTRWQSSSYFLTLLLPAWSFSTNKKYKTLLMSLTVLFFKGLCEEGVRWVNTGSLHDFWGAGRNNPLPYPLTMHFLICLKEMWERQEGKEVDLCGFIHSRLEGRWQHIRGEGHP